MSKAWMTFWYCVAGSPLFSRPGVRPQFCDRPAVTSNSLPKSQTPTFLPASLQMSSSPVSFQATDRVPERWKIWAMSTRSEPGLAGLEDLRDPRDRELGAVGGRADLLRDDRRAAVEELDRRGSRPRSSPARRPRSSRRTGPAAPTGAGAGRSAASAAGDARRRGLAGAGRRRRPGAPPGWRPALAGAGVAVEPRARGEQHGRRSHEPEDARLLPHASPLLSVPARRDALSSAAASRRGSAERYRIRAAGKLARACATRRGSACGCARQPSLRDELCHGITSRSTSAITR